MSRIGKKAIALPKGVTASVDGQTVMLSGGYNKEGSGHKVVVWTVDQPADMARLIEMGVDGIISDRPDLLRKVAGEKGIALPAAFPVMP